MISHHASQISAARKYRDTAVVCSPATLLSCPRERCGGRLRPYPTAQSSYDSVTGLNHLRCGTCGHQGLRVPNGLHLVFRGPDEYVFHYPPSLASLTIAAPPAIVARFTQHGFDESYILTFLAEWVLLTGRTIGMVRFGVETMALEDCYAYFRRHIVQERSVQTA